MASPAEIIDLANLFNSTFGNKPYVVNKSAEVSQDLGEAYQLTGLVNTEEEFTAKGSLIKETLRGIDVLLPVRFYNESDLVMHLPYSVVRLSNKKTIARTSLAERRGTVKELYSIEDYSISIKGFLISEDMKFPEALLEEFRELVETKTALTLDNALTNIFLTDPTLERNLQRRVVILDFDLPEVEGGRVHVKPFSLNLESDSVFDLKWEDI